jgi:hypothetical protein
MRYSSAQTTVDVGGGMYRVCVRSTPPPEETLMAVHWVNYDLNKSGQDYTKLIEYLKSHQPWAKPLKSSFFVKTSLSAGQLRDGIRQHIDTNDDVVVVTVGGQGWATYGLSKELNDWLHANL